MPRLQRADAFLIVIDVQLKLMAVINEREAIERNIERLVRGCKIVDIPALLTEQYVQGLGATVPLVRRQVRKEIKSIAAGGLETIPNPGLSDDIAWSLRRVDLLPQLSHQHSQMFRLLQAVRSPDGKQQGAMRDHTAGAPGQVEQKLEFLGRKPDFAILH